MKCRCFTLIELVVVIAIFGFLVTILFPPLRGSRARAHTVLCNSNIKQLLLGLFTYETENDTLPYGFDNKPPVPPPGGYAGGSTYDRVGWWWFNFIEGYYNECDERKTVVRCPSKRLANLKLKDNILCGNYGVNQSICKSSCGRKSHAEFIGTPLRGTDISNPSQTLLLVDSGYSMITWWHVTDSPPISLSSIIEDTAYIPGLCINKDRLLWPGEEWDAINGRHPNRTLNVGFVDGHVSRTNADDLLVERAGDSYKNLSPLWLPK
jgi:prepilin-type processing-associated H-X9-DG protein/prepilin-type N-terminal cleavage/methylation domain-containing protein